MNRIFQILITLALISSSCFVSAAMIVERSILYYNPGDPSRQDVTIQNPDAEPLYVQVEVFEVVNPGDENEELKLITNPKESSFLVTPNRLAIPPGAQKMVRFVNLKPLGQTERVFRVNLKPVAEDLEAEQMGVKIIVGYQLLVLISPSEQKIELTGKREGKKLTLTNTGNINVLISRGNQCEKGVEPKPGTNSGCAELPAARIYPGNKLEVDLPYDTPVEYLVSSNGSNQQSVY